MTHFRSEHYVGLVTLWWTTFQPILVFLGRFVLDLWGLGQHLSDASRDLATLTFDLVGHGSPLSSTWPHLNSDVGLEKGEY